MRNDQNKNSDAREECQYMRWIRE